MMGIFTEFNLDERRQGMLVHDGIDQASKRDIV